MASLRVPVKVWALAAKVAVAKSTASERIAVETMKFLELDRMSRALLESDGARKQAYQTQSWKL
jgi:hypothetical protein